jgi:ArsR family transcriptional regulator, arsenate/arsenite/antimonite-responsive transcriptional repressor
MNPTVSLFKALSDPNRLRIAWALQNHQELCACQIIKLLKLAPATVSKHLSLLSLAGVIICRKQGRFIHFSLNTGSNDKRVQKMLALLTSLAKNDMQAQDDQKKLKTILAMDIGDLCRKLKK